MKKVLNYLFLATLVFTLSCEDTRSDRFLDNPEFGWIEFQSASTTQAVNASSESIDITVNFTAPINKSAVQISWSVSDVVGDASDAISTESGSLVIGANENQAVLTLPLKAGADLALAAGDISFDVNITAASRGISVGLADGSRTTEHRVNLVCDLDLAQFFNRTFSVTTNYGYHDFLPSFNPHTQNMDITVTGSRQYFIQDFSGGLYNGGPYSSAYGTGPTSMDVTFTNACTQITWSNQSDPWGAIVPLTGGTNSIDINTGVVTISWFCEGYGENGVSVYTPL